MAHLVNELKNQSDSLSPILETLSRIDTYFCESFEHQIELGGYGICDVLCELSMKSPYAEDAEVIEKLLWTIIHACRRTMEKSTSCPQNCNKIVIHARTILEAVSNHILTSPKISGLGAFIFMILASDSQERQYFLGHAGAPLALAAILFKYSDDDFAAEMGCRAVRNLACHDEVGRMMVSEGICEGLVAILKASKEKPQVAEAALWAVVNISCDTQISTIFGSAGGVVALLDVWSSLIGHEGVVSAAGFALRNLCADSAFNLSILSSTPETSLLLADTLATSLQLHQHSSSPREAVLWSIANTASESSLAQLLVERGCLPLLISMLHQQLPFLSASTLWDAISLSESQISEDYLEEEGEGLEALVWAIRNLSTYQPFNPSMQECVDLPRWMSMFFQVASQLSWPRSLQEVSLESLSKMMLSHYPPFESRELSGLKPLPLIYAEILTAATTRSDLSYLNHLLPPLYNLSVSSSEFKSELIHALQREMERPSHQWVRDLDPSLMHLSPLGQCFASLILLHGPPPAPTPVPTPNSPPCDDSTSSLPLPPPSSSPSSLEKEQSHDEEEKEKEKEKENQTELEEEEDGEEESPSSTPPSPASSPLSLKFRSTLMECWHKLEPFSEERMNRVREKGGMKIISEQTEEQEKKEEEKIGEKKIEEIEKKEEGKEGEGRDGDKEQVSPSWRLFDFSQFYEEDFRYLFQ